VSIENQKRLVALLIGLATVTAGLFSWRASQIASAAAFDDRQSIGNELSVQRSNIDVAVEATRQARQYDRYLAEFAVADELAEEAEQLADAGLDELAAVRSGEATGTRREATVRATEAGVFGIPTLTADAAESLSEPQPFDIEKRLTALAAEASTGLLAGGKLDPDAWAEDADAIRVRVADFQLFVLLILAAVILLTVSEVTLKGRVRVVAASCGSVLLLVVAVVGFSGPWS
jgi:hypothetical protein